MRCTILFMSQCLLSSALTTSLRTQFPKGLISQDYNRNQYRNHDDHVLSRRTPGKKSARLAIPVSEEPSEDHPRTQGSSGQAASSGRLLLGYSAPYVSPGPKPDPGKLPPAKAAFDRPYYDIGSKKEGEVKSLAFGSSATATHPQQASVSAKTRNGGIRSYATGTTVQGRLQLGATAAGMIHTTQPNGERTAEKFRGPGYANRIYRSTDPGKHMKIETDLDSGSGKAKSGGTNIGYFD